MRREMELWSNRQFDVFKHMGTITPASLAALLAFREELGLPALSFALVILNLLLSLGASVLGLLLMVFPGVEGTRRGYFWLGILAGTALGGFAIGGVVSLLAPALWLYLTTLFS